MSSQTKILQSLTSGNNIFLSIMHQNHWMTSGYALANSYTLNTAQLTDVMSFISPCNGCFGITLVMAIEGVNGNPKSLCCHVLDHSFLHSFSGISQGLARPCTVVGIPCMVLGIVLVHASLDFSALLKVIILC